MRKEASNWPLYVISKGDGRPITADGYRKLWKSLSSHIELYGMTAINFRTTFCTMMVASGVDIKTAQALMGHATPEMTLKIYAKQEESRIPDGTVKSYAQNSLQAAKRSVVMQWRDR